MKKFHRSLTPASVLEKRLTYVRPRSPRHRGRETVYCVRYRKPRYSLTLSLSSAAYLGFPPPTSAGEPQFHDLLAKNLL